MKRKLFIFVLAACFILATCVQSLEPSKDFDGDPDDIGLVIRLQGLTLDRSELATIGGNDLKLNLTKFPDFASRKDVTWVVRCSVDCKSNCTGNCEESSVQVDQNGNITTTAVDEDEVSVVRVYADNDPYVYADCSIMVFPDYGEYRYWNFNGTGTADPGTSTTDTSTGWYAAKRNASEPEQTRIAYTNNTQFDANIGLGMILRGGTGSGGYNQAGTAPNGLPAAFGDIPPGADSSLYPPFPWVYEIDEEDPYGAGCNPSNGPRSNLRFWGGGGEDFRQGFITTGGSGRIFSIAAIQGPFYIEVGYHTNSDVGADGQGRWVDIRIGDKSGLRIQGEPSRTRATGQGKRVWYYYENDDVVPFVHLEGAQAGAFRVHEVRLLPGPPTAEDGTLFDKP